MAMNLSLSKLPWYGQIGAFVALSAAAMGVFWYWYAQPAQESIATRSAQLATLRGEIDRGLATARRLPEFRGEVADRQIQLDRLRAVLPEERDVADLLRRVQAMATQSNLTILGFTPQAVATRQLHAEWPIGLQLEGTYHDLGAFLERISKFPRIINVNGITIRARENAAGAVTITAQIIATTFVLIDQQAAPARGFFRRRARTRMTRMWPLSISLLAIVLASSSLAAQPPSPQASAPQPPSPQASAPQGGAAAQPPSPAPAGRGAAPPPTEPPGFTYNPEGRRDPFVSLLRRGTGTRGGTVGTRPAGLAGLEVAEVTLRGTVRSREGFVAILQGADQKTYIVRAGDKFFDGTVRTISQNDIVILQQVNDPLLLQKQREVRKVLRQAEAN
jgi:Tfp pilus assembly protein PilO/Tfp pilus assembly protein PilP